MTRYDPEAAVAVCDPQVEFASLLSVDGQAYFGHDGIRQYFADISTAWGEWRVELNRVTAGEDGRVAVVMTMHVRGLESGAALSERVGHVWTLRNGLLWRNEAYREPEQALLEVGARAD